MVFAKQPDRELVWNAIRYKFAQEDLEKIAAEEFADLVNDIVEKEITTQVHKI